LDRVHSQTKGAIDESLLAEGTQLTDVNGALFDVHNGFRGSIAGIHLVLHRQGLLPTVLGLEERERLSPGQMEEIDRVLHAYPHLSDDGFVREHLDRWLA